MDGATARRIAEAFVDTLDVPPCEFISMQYFEHREFDPSVTGPTWVVRFDSYEYPAMSPGMLIVEVDCRTQAAPVRPTM